MPTRELVELEAKGNGEEEKLVGHGDNGRDAQVVVIENVCSPHDGG